MFDVGDIVVCVDDAPKRGANRPIVPIHHLLNKGRVYRIDFVGTTWLGNPTVGLEGIQPPIPMIGFDPYRFRKIKPADPEFIALMQGIKAPRVKEPA